MRRHAAPRGARRARRGVLDLGEALVMAGVVMVAAGFCGVSCVYLTAFARLTAEGHREQELETEISQLQDATQALDGEIARLQRRERIEREARRLGLVVLPPEQVQRMPLAPGMMEPSDGYAGGSTRPLTVGQRPDAPSGEQLP